MKVYEIVFSPPGHPKVVDALCGALPALRLQVDLADRTLDFDAIRWKEMEWR